MSLTRPLIRASLHALALPLAFLSLTTAFALPVGGSQHALRTEAKPPNPRRGGKAHSAGAHALQSVYVAGVLALSVVQQPSGQAAYVSQAADEVTQFSLAASYKTIGLMAHNYLSGGSFLRLAVGQTVRLIYRDGIIEDFVVTQILRFQALQPENPLSHFRDLADDEILSAGQLFRRVYSGRRHLTFQTCIARNGNLSWGRLFVIAMPVAAVPEARHSSPPT